MCRHACRDGVGNAPQTGVRHVAGDANIDTATMCTHTSIHDTHRTHTHTYTRTQTGTPEWESISRQNRLAMRAHPQHTRTHTGACTCTHRSCGICTLTIAERGLGASASRHDCAALTLHMCVSVRRGAARCRCGAAQCSLGAVRNCHGHSQETAMATPKSIMQDMWR